MTANGDGQNRDKVFLIILLIFAGVMILFGLVAITLTVFGEPSDSVVLRVINAFGAMFTGLIGLTVGYLTGRNGRN